MNSLYSKYVAERENARVYETEKGFIKYKVFPNEQYVYIEDIYVTPEHRQAKIATDLADTVCKLVTRENADIKKCFGSVDVQARGADRSLKVLIKYGMRISHLENNMIYMYKEI